MAKVGLSPKVYRVIAVLAATLVALQVYVILSPGSQELPITPPAEPAISKGSWEGGLGLRLESSETVSVSGRLVEVKKYSFTLKPGLGDCRIYMRVVDANGGSGWVLLIHGLGGSSLFWLEGPGASVLAELINRGFNLALVDLAGHGESCIPGGSEWKDLARSLGDPQSFFLYYVYLSGLRAVEALNEIGASDVSVVGLSLGGMTALVVAALHDSVGSAVSIYAAGCLTCMIASGGSANFIGDPDSGLSDKDALHTLARLDPLNFIRSSPMEGKRVWIVMPSHDEYFPLEALEATLAELERSGAAVGFTIAPNGSHYSMPPWLPELVADLLSGKPAGVGGETLVWRPSAKGLSYLPGAGSPVILNLVAPSQVLVLQGSPPATVSVAEGPRVLSILLAALWAAVSVAAGRAGYVFKPWLLPLFSVAAAAIVAGLPAVAWPDRFSLSILELAERYGSTMSAFSSLPSLHAFTAAAIAVPAFLAGVLAVKSRYSTAALALAYVLAVATLYGVPRLTFYTVESLASAEGFESRATIYPVEAALILLLAVAVLAKKRLATDSRLY